MRMRTECNTCTTQVLWTQKGRSPNGDGHHEVVDVEGSVTFLSREVTRRRGREKDEDEKKKKKDAKYEEKETGASDPSW